MSSKILIKRSTTTGAIPTTADLDTGEFAVNTVDKRIFTNNQGTIVELGTTPSTQAVAGNATVGGTFAVTGATTLSTGSTTGNFSVAGTLQLDTEGTASNHVVTKAYVDTAISDLVDGAGSALDTLKELADAINNDANFATTITNSIATKLSKSGDTMTGNLNMGSNKVTSSTNPTADDDLTRKGYVDTILGSATAAATSASEAATSASNAATSEANASASATSASSSASSASSSATSASASATSASTSASSASTSASQASTSASNAATSATNAENAFDSFDDRYLGAKASDPTLDNDGEALLTGAMYFDSSNNVMKVYNGSEWQNASSSIEGIKADFQYTATSGQTAFSGADDNTNTLVIDKAELTNVYLNGVRLATTDYTVTPASNLVTLNVGASTGDIVEIEVFGNFAGQSGADVAITGGSITGLSNLETATFTSTGTVTANGLTVDGSTTVLGSGSSNPALTLKDAGNGQATLNFGDINGYKIQGGADYLGLRFSANNGERMRLDSSGNLLVGKTSSGDPTSAGHVFFPGGVAWHTADGIYPLFLNRNSSDGEIIRLRKNNSTVGSISTVAGNIGIGNGNTGLYISNATDSFTPVSLSTGTPVERDAGIDIGRASARYKDLYLSGGVYLGGTGSANKLDDYEEGTWTPVFTSSGTNPTVTYVSVGSYSGTYGRYVKVGGFVYLYGRIQIATILGGSGALYLSGLPFTKTTDQSDVSGLNISVAFGGTWAANNAPVTGFLTPSPTGFRLKTYDTDDPRDGLDSNILTFPSAGAGLLFSAVYKTNQ